MAQLNLDPDALAKAIKKALSGEAKPEQACCAGGECACATVVVVVCGKECR